MKLCFDAGNSTLTITALKARVSRGTIRQSKVGKVRIVKLETFRLLKSGTEKIQSMAGRRLWVYAPNGRCWNFDVYVRQEVIKLGDE